MLAPHPALRPTSLRAPARAFRSGAQVCASPVRSLREPPSLRSVANSILSPRREKGKIGARGIRGFTLLELIVAFVVFALAFGLLMQVASGSLRNARHSAHFTHAALLAQSKLDELGAGEPLEEGSDSGRFGDVYEWRLDVTKQEAPVAPNGNIDQLPFELVRLELVVEWRDGSRAREARFVTERIQQKVG